MSWFTKYISSELVNRYDIDQTKLEKAVEEQLNGKTEKELYNAKKYISSIIIRLISEDIDSVKRKPLRLNFTSLFNAMRENKFSGNEVDKKLIELIETHIITEFPHITDYDLANTNKLIINYCVSKKTTTYADFVNYFMSSKLAKKVNIPYSDLVKRATKETDEMNEIINGIGKT